MPTNLHRDRVTPIPKPGPKKKKSSPRVTDKERHLQALSEQYLEVRQVVYIRLPDTLLSSIYANSYIPAREKAMISSYIKGLPDLVIFHPSLRTKGYPVVLPLELKTEVGKMSRAQLNWQEKIDTRVARGWDEIKQEIDNFLQLKRDS